MPVIALVASAGGIDAVSRVLAPMPADLHAAIVVLIHQQPDRASHLVDILDRRCPLEVVQAEHGAALRPRRVVVTPPGTHLLITPDLEIALIASGTFPPNRPSADLLLATLATAAAERAIAVVLSGGGHDGATGATAIHSFGGVVIASDEASSQQYSMPLAAIERDDAVDHILALDDVAELLGRLVAAAGG